MVMIPGVGIVDDSSNPMIPGSGKVIASAVATFLAAWARGCNKILQGARN
jgi:hypothetical protein